MRIGYRRPAIQTSSVALVGLLIVAASAAGYFAVTTSKSTASQSTTSSNGTTTVIAAETYAACMDQGFGSPCASGDIVNGPVTVNASQYSFYQFDIPYGAQDIAVNVQWSSGGAIGVYVMNATELIGWQNGHGLRTFYNSGQAQQGDLNLKVPPDDLYYLVFDNSLSSAARNVQATSGFSYMCNLCSTAPIQQMSSSAAACVAVNGSEACSVALSNLGSATASPTGTCIESWSADEGPGLTWGTPHLGVFTPRTAMSPSSSLSGTCTVAGSTAPLAPPGLAITVQIPFTGGDNVDLYGPVSLNTVVVTVTVTETLTTQASQATTTYAQPTSNCAETAPTETITTTIIVGPPLPASTTTTTTTVTTTSTSYTQTVTVTSCTYSMPTATSTVTTTSVLGRTG